MVKPDRREDTEPLFVKEHVVATRCFFWCFPPGANGVCQLTGTGRGCLVYGVCQLTETGRGCHDAHVDGELLYRIFSDARVSSKS